MEIKTEPILQSIKPFEYTGKKGQRVLYIGDYKNCPVEEIQNQQLVTKYYMYRLNERDDVINKNTPIFTFNNIGLANERVLPVKVFKENIKLQI